MWKHKLCLGLNDQFDADPLKQLELIKQAGFDAFFCGWREPEEMASVAARARELDLKFQSVHAPFDRCDLLWEQKSDEAEGFVKVLIDCVRACERYSVPVMVSHVFIGFNGGPAPSSAGLSRFERVVEEAEKSGVRIAFENTEGEEYLSAVMNHFRDHPNVGFCLDTGHEMCYNHSSDLLSLYGDRLIATHLNDNLGPSAFDGSITWLDDLHLLPFDGICDWQRCANRLVDCGYDGILTFELNRASKPGRHDNDKYGSMPIESYLAEAYARACRFASLTEGFLKERINY